MELKIISKNQFLALLRFYFASIVGGLIFATIIIVLKGNYQIAELVTVIFCAFGVLYIGYVTGLVLISKGLDRWKVNSCLLLLTIIPGVFLYISLALCLGFFAVAFPLGWYAIFCTKNEGISSSS
jgi:hypothetical protein